MKKLILTSLLIFLLSQIMNCQQIELDKINDFFIAQSYLQNDNIIVEDGYVFTLSIYGLEILEINPNGELNLISNFPVTCSISFAKYLDYIYISSGSLSSIDHWGKLYKINVENKFQPFIEDTIDFDFRVFPIQIYENVLDVTMYNQTNSVFQHFFYSLPNLELLTQYTDYFRIMNKINNSTSIRFDGYNQFTVFDISDIENPLILGNGDISSVHPSNIHRVNSYQDTVLVFSELNKISFWDVSDWSNWQYISQLTPQYFVYDYYKPLIRDSLMVLVESEHVELVNLSNIYNPEQVFLLSGTAGPYSRSFIDDFGDNLYFTTTANGIQRLKLTGDSLVFEDEFHQYTRSYQYKVENFIISTTDNYEFKYSDFSNPTSPLELGNYLPNYNPFITISGNKLAAFESDGNECDIYDISDIHNSLLVNEINTNINFEKRMDSCDENSIFFIDKSINHFSKIDISQTGVNNQIFDISLMFEPIDWIIHDGYAYFLEYVDTFERRLYIYENLNTNQPILSNVIDNFVTNPDLSLMKIENDMLAIYTKSANHVIPTNRTRFFSLDIPDQPEFHFSVDAYGEPFINNDLVFIACYYQCPIFELPDSTISALQPIHIFNDISGIEDIYFVDYDNIKYILLCQISHVGVFSYEYIQSGVENNFVIQPDYLINHPNPFNPSTEIRFQISDFRQITEAKIEIYNLKGQKVKSIKVSESQSLQVSVIWDGTDQNNQPVASGVYFYQLQVDGKAMAQKKCLLLK